MQGWICLHRQLLEWEWYDDINARCLFIHCLLRANHKDGKWKGQTIPRGSFITGRNSLADEVGLTVQQIRTALDKLKSTNDLTIKATNKNSLVTVVNYGVYQDKGEVSTNGLTNKPLNEQPTNNQQITTNNNDNNEDNVNNKELSVPKNGTPKVKQAQVDFSVLGFSKEQIDELKRIRKANKGGSLSQRVVNSLAKEFDLAMQKGFSIDELLTEWEVRSWKSFKAEWIKQNPNQQQRFSQGTQQALQVISNLEYPGDD